MIKQAGLCSLCEVECFEILERFDDQYPHLVGKVKKLKDPLDNAWRVTLLLTDGARMDVTVCHECLPEVLPRFSELWKNILETYAWELSDEYRGDLKLEIFTEERKRQEMLTILTRPAVGILYTQRWPKHA